MHGSNLCESPRGKIEVHTATGANPAERMEDCKTQCSANAECAGLSAHQSWNKCQLMYGPISQTSKTGFKCLEHTKYVHVPGPGVDYTAIYTHYGSKKCLAGRVNLHFKATKQGVYTPIGASRDERRKDCLAKCDEYPTCETVTAQKTWNKCFILGFGTVKEDLGYFDCYEKNNVDEYSFTKRENMQCLGTKSMRTKRMMAKLSRGLGESELRACHKLCAEDPACGAISIRNNNCFFIAGRGRDLRKKAKAGDTCYEKDLSAQSKTDICGEAKAKGLCDGAFESVSDCKTAFDNSALATKFCPMVANNMIDAGKRFKFLPEVAMENSSISAVCGAECPGTTWTKNVDKKCGAHQITKELEQNIGICFSKCAANDACKAVYRKGVHCMYQSEVVMKDSAYSGNEWQKKEYCFVKN